jgi:hypothetical protein
MGYGQHSMASKASGFSSQEREKGGEACYCDELHVLATRVVRSWPSSVVPYSIQRKTRRHSVQDTRPCTFSCSKPLNSKNQSDGRRFGSRRRTRVCGASRLYEYSRPNGGYGGLRGTGEEKLRSQAVLYKETLTALTAFTAILLGTLVISIYRWRVCLAEF